MELRWHWPPAGDRSAPRAGSPSRRHLSWYADEGSQAPGCPEIRRRRPAGLRSRAAGPAAGTGTCPLPDAALLPGAGLHARPSALPASPGTRQLHRRYTAGRREVHPSGLAEQRRRAAPVAGRREGDGRYTEGPSQVHGRTIAGQWHRAAWERKDPRPRGAHRAPVRRPFPPDGEDGAREPAPARAAEAAVTGPARWRPSPGRSACWSPGRSRWPCGRTAGPGPAGPAGAAG